MATMDTGQAVKYLDKNMASDGDLDVVVDVEDVLYFPKKAVASVAQDCLEYHTGETHEVLPSHYDGWNESKVVDRMTEALGWREGKKVENHLFGDGEYWPGFHPVSDAVWTGQTSQYDFCSHNYTVPSADRRTVESFENLWNNNGIDVDVLTSRTEDLSDFDSQTAIRDRIANDFGSHGSVEEQELLKSLDFTKEKLNEYNPDVIIDDSPTRRKKAENRPEVAVLVPETYHTTRRNEENVVEDFTVAAKAIINHVDGKNVG